MHACVRDSTLDTDFEFILKIANLKNASSPKDALASKSSHPHSCLCCFKAQASKLKAQASRLKVTARDVIVWQASTRAMLSAVESSLSTPAMLFVGNT